MLMLFLKIWFEFMVCDIFEGKHFKRLTSLF